MVLDLSTLNDSQRTAVNCDDGVFLVLAGPGSGKTRVLTLRIARLLNECEDIGILALTFTSSAASEMRGRVTQLLGREDPRVHLCTFHSFAADLLRQHGSHLGLRPDFTLLNLNEDRMAILEPLIRELEGKGYSLPADYGKILDLIDRLFADWGEIGDSGAPAVVNGNAWISTLFEQYCAALVSGNRLDFGALLHFARRLLAEKPGVARVVRLGWTHVCVDEFQDTNAAQYALLKLLVEARSPNLFIVGDDDQIIYQWNGASPERLRALRSDFPSIRVIQLPESYRCPAAILEAANRLISYNHDRTPDKEPLRGGKRRLLMDVEPPSGEVIRVLPPFEFPEAEAAGLAEDIANRRLRPETVAVLARTVRLAELAVQAIGERGMHAWLAKRKSTFDSPMAALMLNTLQMANTRSDQEVLRRQCVAWKALTKDDIVARDVVASADLLGGDLLRAWIGFAGRVNGSYGDLIRRIQASLVDRIEYREILDWFLANGWKELGGKDDPVLCDEMKVWEEDLDPRFVGHTLDAYLQHMALESKSSPPAPNAVSCMTIHAAKGQGFDHVYLMGMANEVFPNYFATKRGPRSREMEEERRQCFVAITRTKQTLTLTRSERYTGWPKSASQFLTEMGLPLVP